MNLKDLLPKNKKIKVWEYYPNDKNHILAEGYLLLVDNNGSFEGSTMFNRLIENLSFHRDHDDPDPFFHVSFSFKLHGDPIHTEFTGDYHPIPPYWYMTLFIKKIEQNNGIETQTELNCQIHGYHHIGYWEGTAEDAEGNVDSISIAIWNEFESEPFSILLKKKSPAIDHIQSQNRPKAK